MNFNNCFWNKCQCLLRNNQFLLPDWEVSHSKNCLVRVILTFQKWTNALFGHLQRLFFLFRKHGWLLQFLSSSEICTIDNECRRYMCRHGAWWKLAKLHFPRIDGSLKAYHSSFFVVSPFFQSRLVFCKTKINVGLSNEAWSCKWKSKYNIRM